MLITEKRLRQIVSSELRRMFLSEAIDVKMLPPSDYKSAAVYLDPIMKRAGAGNQDLYSKFTELVQLGKGHPSAAAISKSLMNPNQTSKQKFLSALVALLTAKEVRIEDMKDIAAGNPPGSLGLSKDQLDAFLSGMKFTVENNTLAALANTDPSELAAQALSAEKKEKTEKTTTAPTEQKPAGIDYTIAAGDTISKLLNKYYGIPAATASSELYDFAKNLFYTAQGIPPNADTIKVGMKLRLPDDINFKGKAYKRK